MMKRMLLAGVSALLICSGCAWFEPNEEEKSAQELVQDGVESFDDGKYKAAIESFEKLRDWYPFSKYAILAELKIADAYFNLESYADAIFAYEEFEQLHPRNEAIPYVIYRIGRSYFDQIDTTDRGSIQCCQGFGNLSSPGSAIPGRCLFRHGQERYGGLLSEPLGP